MGGLLELLGLYIMCYYAMLITTTIQICLKKKSKLKIKILIFCFSFILKISTN